MKKNVIVSGSVLLCKERCELAKLIVKFEKKCRGNSKATVQEYYGELWYAYNEITVPLPSTSVANDLASPRMN